MRLSADARAATDEAITQLPTNAPASLELDAIVADVLRSTAYAAASNADSTANCRCTHRSMAKARQSAAMPVNERGQEKR